MPLCSQWGIRIHRGPGIGPTITVIASDEKGTITLGGAPHQVSAWTRVCSGVPSAISVDLGLRSIPVSPKSLMLERLGGSSNWKFCGGSGWGDSSTSQWARFAPDQIRCAKPNASLLSPWYRTFIVAVGLRSRFPYIQPDLSVLRYSRDQYARCCSSKVRSASACLLRASATSLCSKADSFACLSLTK